MCQYAQFAGGRPLTMRALTARPDLEIRIRAGHGGLDRTVRWAHVTELQTRCGGSAVGELVLTWG